MWFLCIANVDNDDDGNDDYSDDNDDDENKGGSGCASYNCDYGTLQMLTMMI